MLENADGSTIPEPTRETQVAVARLATSASWQPIALAVLQRLLGVVAAGCQRLGSSGAAARVTRVCLLRTLRHASLDFLEIQVRGSSLTLSLLFPLSLCVCMCMPCP